MARIEKGAPLLGDPESTGSIQRQRNLYKDGPLLNSSWSSGGLAMANSECQDPAGQAYPRREARNEVERWRREKVEDQREVVMMVCIG